MLFRSENLFTIGSVLQSAGYRNIFAYGGYGYFDNMNAYFSANNYRVFDRQAIPSNRIEFENIWGVADEHLYDFALDEIERDLAKGQPVYAHILTTSNHRPYTYPADRIDIPSGTGRDGAVKYTDYAVGKLLEAAKKRAWLDRKSTRLNSSHT